MSKSKATLIFLLSVPLLLGAVASKQQAVKNDVALNRPVAGTEFDRQTQPLSTAQPTTLETPTQDVTTLTSDASTNVANYAIDWYSINGGGTGNASSTNYQLGASVGQSVAGAASSPSYQMGIGFWYGATGGGCTCPCKYDPQCDGTISDVLDVSLTINRAFRGAAIVQDPGCPVERTDVNASTATDVIDVTKVINVAFRGMTVASQYVDPCAP